MSKPIQDFFSYKNIVRRIERSENTNFEENPCEIQLQEFARFCRDYQDELTIANPCAVDPYTGLENGGVGEY